MLRDKLKPARELLEKRARCPRLPSASAQTHLKASMKSKVSASGSAVQWRAPAADPAEGLVVHPVPGGIQYGRTICSSKRDHQRRAHHAGGRPFIAAGVDRLPAAR